MEYKLIFRHSRDVLGECDTSNLTLLLDNQRPDIRIAKTLMHEISHAMLFEVNDRNWLDEDLVDTLQTALFDLLRNNDFSWMREEAQEQGEEVVFVPVKDKKGKKGEN